MNPLWTLLFVLSAPRGVLSQVQLRESGPSLVKPSQTLSLTCTVSGFSLSSYTVSWVPQAPGKALECLGGISSGGSTGYNPALKSRLSIIKDNSKNQVSLSVNSVTPEDTATYYCIKVSFGGDDWGNKNCFFWTYDYANNVDAWGQGLPVTVSSASTTAPK
nr:immunoglobulin gamma heavy chain [Bos taurus]NDP18711.1 immunoglobulin gamma heavy chain [Bos taurus]